MSSINASLIAFVCTFGGMLCGMALRRIVPEHHLSAESKDAVKVGTTLVGTMTALILGLLLASAKSAYDAQNAELTQMSAKFVLLDRVLAHYGPETKDVRDLLRSAVVHMAQHLWSRGGSDLSRSDPNMGSELIYDRLQQLSPKSDTQHSLKGQALNIAIDLGQTRWLMYEQEQTTASLPLVVALIFWLTISFISFGLFAPTNATSVAAMFVSALSVSVAILLILEMYTPYSGLIHISDAPLRTALAHLSQ